MRVQEQPPLLPRNLMKCQRCGGFMRFTLLRDKTSYSGQSAFVCLLCGDIIDEVIIRNRMQYRPLRRPVQGSPSRRRRAPRLLMSN